MKPRLLPFAIVLVVACLPAAPAAGPLDGTPGSRWVSADFTLEQPTVRDVNLVGTLLFHEQPLRGEAYTADRMREAYNDPGFAGSVARDAIVAELEAQARATLQSILSSSFPGASVTVHPAVADVAGLSLPDDSPENPYEPAVRVTVGAAVARTSEQVGLGDYSDAAVAAVFRAGALVNASFSLSAPTGYDALYHISVPASPAGLVFVEAAGQEAILSADGRTVSVHVDNTQGGVPARAVSARIKDATAAAPAAEDVRATVDIRLGELRPGVASLPVAANVTAEVRALDVAARYPGVLPSRVSLAHLGADGIRELRAAGAIGDAQLQRGDDALLGSIRDDLSAALGSPVVVSGGLARDDMAPSQKGKPIGFAASAQGDYPLEGQGGENLDLALRLGGRVTFDLTLFASRDRVTTFVLHPPPGALFLETDEGVLAADGTGATFQVPAAGRGSRAFPVTLTMGGEGAPSFLAEDATLDVVVDLRDLDVSLSGGVGDMVVDVTVTGELRVVKVPDALREELGDRLALELLPSDGVRLLRQRGLLDEANLTKLEDAFLDQVRASLDRSLGARSEVTGGFDRDSLDPALVSDPVSGGKPIVLEAHTSFRRSFAGSPDAKAAIALYTHQKTFNLPKVQALDTVYTVVLPRGIAVSDLQVTGGSQEVGEAPDGRSQFTVTPTGSAAKATVSMAVTPTFVLLKFWPLVLLAVMVLVLVAGTPVALVLRGRAKRKAAAAKTKAAQAPATREK